MTILEIKGDPVAQIPIPEGSYPAGVIADGKPARLAINGIDATDDAPFVSDGTSIRNVNLAADVVVLLKASR